MRIVLVRTYITMIPILIYLKALKTSPVVYTDTENMVQSIGDVNPAYTKTANII